MKTKKGHFYLYFTVVIVLALYIAFNFYKREYVYIDPTDKAGVIDTKLLVERIFGHHDYVQELVLKTNGISGADLIEISVVYWDDGMKMEQNYRPNSGPMFSEALASEPKLSSIYLTNEMNNEYVERNGLLSRFRSSDPVQGKTAKVDQINLLEIPDRVERLIGYIPDRYRVRDHIFLKEYKYSINPSTGNVSEEVQIVVVLSKKKITRNDFSMGSPGRPRKVTKIETAFIEFDFTIDHEHNRIIKYWQDEQYISAGFSDDLPRVVETIGEWKYLPGERRYRSLGPFDPGWLSGPSGVWEQGFYTELNL